MSSTDHGSHAAPPEEPKTPMWLPAVGVLVFLVAGIWFATRPEPPKAVADDTAAAAAPSASASAPTLVPAGGVRAAAGGAPADPHAGHGH